MSEKKNETSSNEEEVKSKEPIEGETVYDENGNAIGIVVNDNDSSAEKNDCKNKSNIKE